MTPEELERMQQHIREQLVQAGMTSWDTIALRALTLYISETRQALTPAGYYQAYRAIAWCIDHREEGIW